MSHIDVKRSCSFIKSFPYITLCTHTHTHTLQKQYDFIHRGLSELIVCGETEIEAANLQIAINNLEKMTDEGVTGFQKQLQVHIYKYMSYLLGYSLTRSLMR